MLVSCGTLPGCSFLPRTTKFCTLWDERKLEDSSKALHKGDPAKAEALVLDVLKRSPENPEARRRLIDIYLQQDRLDEAINQMQLAIQISPDDCQSYCNLAALLMEQDRSRDAQRIIDLALRMEPANSRLLLMKGNLLEQDRNPIDAQEVYYRVLEVDRENSEAMFRLAGLAMETNHLDQAQPLLRQVLQHPETTLDRRREAERLLASAYARTERWQQAALILQQHLCDNEPQPDDLYRLAYAQYRSGDTGSARLTLEQLRALAPDSEAALTLARQITPQEAQVTRTAHGRVERTTGFTPVSSPELPPSP